MDRAGLQIWVLCLASAGVFACGDDGHEGHEADAAVDAMGTPDAAATQFPGVISVVEVTVSNDTGVTVQGASIGVTYTDPATVTVDAVEGYENNVGGCRIVAYDVGAGESEPPAADVGPVTITGTAAGDIVCSSAGDRYHCSSTDAAATGSLPAATTSLTPNGDGTVSLVITDADFSGADYKGHWIVLSGFDETEANGSFPVLGVLGATTLSLFNPALGADATLSADGSYQLFVGEGPIPLGYDFLDDGTSDIVVSKGATDNTAAVNRTLNANGEGLTLVGTLPHEVPTDGSEVTFACTGSCGVSEGAIKGITVSGRTTDGDLTGLQVTDMPDPVTSFATFQCSGIGASSITLDEGAMAAILGTNPTRIQFSVSYVQGSVGTSNIVVGHNLTGYTDL